MKGIFVAALVHAVCFISAATESTLQNVALGGRATMSSQLPDTNIGQFGHAMNAIDGNLNSNYYQASCSHTDREQSPWWRVDLLSSYKIEYVTITVTNTVPERMNGAELLIGDSLANNGNTNPRCAIITTISSGETQTFQCNGMVGRYVNLFLRNKLEYLTPCEVQVFAYVEDQCCPKTC
ncbi:fucolectin-like [Lissotriton helveticus]